MHALADVLAVAVYMSTFSEYGISAICRSIDSVLSGVCCLLQRGGGGY